jgi:hypothetical protein
MDRNHECTLDSVSCGLFFTCLTKKLGGWLTNLDNHSSNVSNLVNIVEKKWISWKKPLVLEVVIFNSCKGLHSFAQFMSVCLGTSSKHQLSAPLIYVCKYVMPVLAQTCQLRQIITQVKKNKDVNHTRANWSFSPRLRESSLGTRYEVAISQFVQAFAAEIWNPLVAISINMLVP